MTENLTNLMEKDFEDTLSNSVEKIDQQGLTSVAALARTIRDKEALVSTLEEKIKARKKL